MLNFLNPVLSNRGKGVLCLSLIVTIYTASGFIVSEVMKRAHASFFTTYVSSAFMVLLLFFYLNENRATVFKGSRKLFPCVKSEDSSFQDPETCSSSENVSERKESDTTSIELIKIVEINRDEIDVTHNDVSSIEEGGEVSQARVPGLSFRETFKIAFWFSILYFSSNYLQTLGFEKTSVGNASIILSTCAFLTLVLGTILRIDKMTVLKLLGILISLLGVFLIHFRSILKDNDNDGKEHSSEYVLGDIFAFLSAVIYAIYSNMMKKMCPDESRLNPFLFFGLVGVISSILFCPFFFILDTLGMERMPTNSVALQNVHDLIFIFGNALISSVFAMYLWYVAMAYTSSIMVAISLSLVTPASFVVESVLYSEGSDRVWYEWFAVALVTFATVLVNYADLRPRHDLSIGEACTLISRALCSCGRADKVKVNSSSSSSSHDDEDGAKESSTTSSSNLNTPAL